MIDIELERQIRDLKELMGLWRRFHDYFAFALKGQDLTKEREMSFFELKSKVAILHDTFMTVLTHDQNIGQGVLTIISKTITLKHIHRLNEAEIKKLEIEWHESYLLLNESIGELEDKKIELGKINKTHYALNKYIARTFDYVSMGLHTIYFKIVAVTTSIIFVIWGVPAFEIYDYKELRHISSLEKPYYTYVKFYRKFIDEDFMYDNTKEALYDYTKRKIPKDFEEPKYNTGIETQILGQIYSHFNVVLQLQARKEFGSLEIKTQDSIIVVHVFLFEDVDSPEEILARIDSIPDTNEVKRNLSVFRKANCLYAIHCDNPPPKNLLAELYN